MNNEVIREMVKTAMREVLDQREQEAKDRHQSRMKAMAEEDLERCDAIRRALDQGLPASSALGIDLSRPKPTIEALKADYEAKLATFKEKHTATMAAAEVAETARQALCDAQKALSEAVFGTAEV